MSFVLNSTLYAPRSTLFATSSSLYALRSTLYAYDPPSDLIPSCKQQTLISNDFDRIESVFRNIPDSIQTSVYWYWVSDNISKEGVIKDLRAMKEEWVSTAFFIGNIGLNEGYSRIPYGTVKIFTDECGGISAYCIENSN